MTTKHVTDVSQLPPSTLKRPHQVDPEAWTSTVLQRWGIDPAGVTDSEPEPLGPVLRGCGESTDAGPCPGRWRVRSQDGAVWEAACDACGFEAGVPAVQVDPAVRQRQLLDQAGLPELFVGLVFEEDGDNRDALYLLRAWLADFGKGDPMPAPAIWGEQGRGKSHLLTALCTRLVREHGATVMFRSIRELLRGLQRFDDDFERNQLWERAVSVDVLALDDLGAQQITDWRHDQIAHLVDERYQAERPIVLATNYRPSAWDQVVDRRTASRLAGMTLPVQLKGHDRRQQQIETTTQMEGS